MDAPADQQEVSFGGQGILSAWDYSTSPDHGLGIYEVGIKGAKRAGSTPIPTSKRGEVVASLRRLGLRIGGTYGGHHIVWVADDQGCVVWSNEAIRASGTNLELVVAGKAIHTSDVRAVVSFVDDDLIHRGVSIELRNGDSRVFVDEHEEIASIDPTYSRSDLLMSDARWVTALGRDLAAWLHLPHRDVAFSNA